MKTTILCLIALTLLCGAALAAPDSLACRMIDWLDVPGTMMHYGSTGDGGYNYSGTCLWDMAMGDSFLVWCPGTDWFYFINPFSQSEVETLNGFDYGSVGAKGVTVNDSLTYIVGGGGVNTTQYRNDSLIVIDGLWIPSASFHYAVIQDTFLYTASTGSYGLHCIKIANPESIFVAWTTPTFYGKNGMIVVNDYAYAATATHYMIEPEFDGHQRAQWIVNVVRIYGDTIGVGDSLLLVDYMGQGDLATDGEYPFYVYTEMSDFIAGEQDYTLGDSHLGIWGTDYSYTWTDYDSEGVFGVDVLNERILAVGFEHGFSILDFSDLDDIREVAYYRDTDSIFAFTHFALKENRMFAMAHPRAGICRMFMFEIEDSVITGQGEASMPEKFQFWNYPNPFNSSCKFAFSGFNEPVRSIEIFDINGRLVDTIEMGGHKTLPYEVIWKPESLSSGLYLARIVMRDKTFTAKLVYLQ